MAKTAAAFLFIALLIPSAAAGGTYGMTTVAPYASWEPSDCFKPSPPVFFVSDLESYNRAVDEYNEYLSRIKTFMLCVQEDGKADAESIVKSITQGVSNAQDEALRELNVLKMELESSRALAR
ncbi:hypothetical protein [Pseudodesulfovibrio sp.]|uniref:hypothetical protein n=1 Tax=Pseudodesulfovibrio sp. TaxID=2035812 RepID=UPI00262EB35A|nr:hypothetical protein [Pseudodesulfovibrio sp.]MDD3313402.1 hypothetical protein [Pseudodesulfovibrio sp.]